MIENQSFLAVSINICQSVIFLRTICEGLSAFRDRMPGNRPFALSSHWYRALFGQLGLHQGLGELLFTLQKRAGTCVQSNHPALGSLITGCGGTFEGFGGQRLLIQHLTAPDQRVAEVFRYAVSI
jgi:hypothetical protein